MVSASEGWLSLHVSSTHSAGLVRWGHLNTTNSGAKGLRGENRKYWVQGGHDIGVQEAERSLRIWGLRRGDGIWSWNPCHDHIPVLPSSSAPALHTLQVEQQRREREGEKSPQTSRRSLLAKSGLAGRGGGCGAGTSDAISCWGTVKVAVLPGGARVPAEVPCLLSRLLPPAWAAHPGYAPPGCLSLARLFLSASSLLFPLSLPFFLLLPHSFSFLPLSSPLILSCIFLPFYFFHAFSRHLFFSNIFAASSFAFSLMLIFSFFLPLSLAFWFLLCLALKPQIVATQEQEGPCTLPWGRWALPL